MTNHLTFNDRRFPAGTFGSDKLPPEKRLAWTVPITLLRYSQGTKSNFDPAVAWDKEPNLNPEIAGWPVPHNPLFHCADGTAFTPPDTLQTSSFVGMAGLGKDAATLPAGDPSAGIFGYRRQTTLADLADNREHRVCALDTTRDNGPWTAGGPPTLRPFLPDETPFIGEGRQFGGHHANGAVALMADFHVRVFNPKIDAGVFARLCAIAQK
jgi:hypothetical protein